MNIIIRNRSIEYIEELSIFSVTASFIFLLMASIDPFFIILSIFLSLLGIVGVFYLVYKKVHPITYGKLSLIYGTYLLVIFLLIFIFGENSLILLKLIAQSGFCLFYILPLLIAYSLNHKDFNRIAVINIFTGFTIIGWLIAFAWSLMDIKKLIKKLEKEQKSEFRVNINKVKEEYDKKLKGKVNLKRIKKLEKEQKKLERETAQKLEVYKKKRFMIFSPKERIILDYLDINRKKKAPKRIYPSKLCQKLKFKNVSEVCKLLERLEIKGYIKWKDTEDIDKSDKSAYKKPRRVYKKPITLTEKF